MTAVQAQVHGMVQGVGFRWSCVQQAEQLGVAGWVRNLADGSVELWAEGDEQAVAALLEWCRTGPRWARVEHVETLAVAPQGLQGFRVR